ncbi:Variant Ionotropic Glutamate Receptor [Penaeus vannamei]|uniref:Variant Ionotropic Glutamate Receptor n=1 Tax=Penaeus vannamei TaxID=6689 RepID=A0A423TJW7_PENVA|nr:glutamate receptor ionotropic, delta-2-like [Penaeus vannamei]ROT76759.1 Variant Ionotropic Glutamate Receptor [Penaeus vannamei]
MTSAVQVFVLAALLSHAGAQQTASDRNLRPGLPRNPGGVHEESQLISMAVRAAESSVILQDGSPEALDVLQNFLASPHHLSIQLGNMLSLLQERGDFPNFRRGLNEEKSIVVMVFSDVDVVRKFIEAKDVLWIPCPLLLLSLTPGEDSRDILKEVNKVARSSLLEPHFSRGRPTFCLLTYRPFASSAENIVVQSCGSRIVFSWDDLFPERFGSFEGRHLEVASWIDDFPFLFYDSKGTATGICKKMLDEIAEQLNFTYELQVEPPDGYWGDLVNGTWHGMAGQVVYGQKDLLINGFGILLDRYHAMDLSVPHTFDSYKVAMKLPPPPPRWLAVVYPFQGVVWACAVATLLVLTCAFHVIIRKEHSSVYDRESDLISTALWLSRTVLKQSVTRIPNVVGCRPVLYLWWMGALVLSTSYTGSLIAFLTVPSEASKITSLVELAKAPNELCLYDYGDFIVNFLKTSKEPVYRALGEKLHLYYSYDVISQKIEQGFAFVEAALYCKYLLIQWKKKDAYIIQEGIYPNYYGWAFRKQTPWKKQFNKYISRILEAGLLDQWHRTLVADFRRSQGLLPVQTPPEKEGLHPLSLEDTQGPFIAAAFGLISATVVFLVEMMSVVVKGGGGRKSNICVDRKNN